VAGVVEQVDTEGRKALIPGLESPGVPAGEIPALLWESAVESARSKKRWRDQCVGAGAGNALWADASWRDSPAVWRSCALFDAADPVTEECRALLSKGGEEIPAGLVAIVKTPRGEAEDLSQRWMESGWTVVTVSRDDSIGLYETLTEADMSKPLAVVLTIGAAVSARLHVSRTAIRRREEGLLGEMSDDQFSEVMGEFLGGE
jgi:cob(I)alamin adenosyltransferase